MERAFKGEKEVSFEHLFPLYAWKYLEISRKVLVRIWNRQAYVPDMMQKSQPFDHETWGKISSPFGTCLHRNHCETANCHSFLWIHIYSQSDQSWKVLLRQPFLCRTNIKCKSATHCLFPLHLSRNYIHLTWVWDVFLLKSFPPQSQYRLDVRQPVLTSEALEN